MSVQVWEGDGIKPSHKAFDEIETLRIKLFRNVSCTRAYSEEMCVVAVNLNTRLTDLSIRKRPNTDKIADYISKLSWVNARENGLLNGFTEAERLNILSRLYALVKSL